MEKDEENWCVEENKGEKEMKENKMGKMGFTGLSNRKADKNRGN